MSKKTTIICVRDCCDNGNNYKFGNKYIYFNSSFNRIYNTIYRYSDTIAISMVGYDFFSDNFIEDDDINMIDDLFGKKLDSA
jgi:hypothetical protein